MGTLSATAWRAAATAGPPCPSLAAQPIALHGVRAGGGARGRRRRAHRRAGRPAARRATEGSRPRLLSLSFSLSSIAQLYHLLLSQAGVSADLRRRGGIAALWSDRRRLRGTGRDGSSGPQRPSCATYAGCCCARCAGGQDGWRGGGSRDCVRWEGPLCGEGGAEGGGERLLLRRGTVTVGRRIGVPGVLAGRVGTGGGALG